MAFITLKRVLTLRKYVDGVPTDAIKENLIENSDYIAPYQDYVDCPIGSTDPTPTPTQTVTPTPTPSETPSETPSGSTTTCREVTYDSSLFSLDMDVYGIAYTDHTGTFQITSFNGLGFSEENGSEFTYRVCASSINGSIYSTSDNQFYPQYDSALSIVNSGAPCSSQADCIQPI